MLANRSMPHDVLVPVLAYPSVGEAVEWLCSAFGFTRRWQAGDHRAQLAAGSGAVALTAGPVPEGTPDHVMLRVDDVAAHRARAAAAGARVEEISEHPYGERQYAAVDHAGRRWLFSESVADVRPSDWGADEG